MPLPPKGPESTEPRTLLRSLAVSPGLGGVCLVHEDRAAAGGDRLDLIRTNGNFWSVVTMTRADCPGKASASWAGDSSILHDAVGMLKLVDRVLQLPAQHEGLVMTTTLSETFSLRASCRLEPVGEPGAGVGLAGARRVLYQVALPRSVPPGVARHHEHGVPLVVVGKITFPADLAPFVNCAGFSTWTNRSNKSSRCVLLPQVRGAVALRIRWVPGAELVTAVERQEARRAPGEPRRHRGCSVATSLHEGVRDVLLERALVRLQRHPAHTIVWGC